MRRTDRQAIRRAETAHAAAQREVAQLSQRDGLTWRLALTRARAAEGNAAGAHFVGESNYQGVDDPVLGAPSCAGECAVAPFTPARVAWVEAVRAYQMPHWEALAADHHLPLADYLARVDDRLRQALRGTRLYVRVPVAALPAIQEAGRIGLSSETGCWGGGRLAVRQQTERAVFGDCPRCTPESARRIYAYACRPAVRERATHASRDFLGLDRFGEVDLELAPQVALRSTVSFGVLPDCTDCGHTPGICPQPLAALGILNHLAFGVYAAERAFGWRGWRTTYTRMDPLAPGVLAPGRHVVQVQVRGPVMLHDVVAVHAAVELTVEARDALTAFAATLTQDTLTQDTAQVRVRA